MKIIIRICFGLLALGLAACGSNIELSPSVIALSVFKSPTGQYEPHAITVHIRYVGDDVGTGFPNGTIHPDWLTRSGWTVRALDHEADLDIALTPPANASGHYATNLRIWALNGHATSYRDLPISIDIKPPVSASSQSLAFSSSSVDSAPPAAQRIQLDPGALTGLTSSGHVKSTNNGLTDWLRFTPLNGGKQVEVAPAKVLPVGHYEGNIVLDLAAGETTGQITLPVTYDVTPGRPEPRFVAPRVAYLNEAGTFALRGVGFDTAPILDVRVGGRPATSFEVVSPTELRVHYAAFDTAGSKLIELVTATRTWVADMPLLVKPRLAGVAGTLKLQAKIITMVFDSTRDVLFARTDTTLYRLKLGSGAWSIDAERNIDAINVGAGEAPNIDLTPDARYLVSLHSDKVTLRDPETLADVETFSLPFITRGAEPAFYLTGLYGILNSGTALTRIRRMTNSSPDDPARYLTFDVVNRTFRWGEEEPFRVWGLLMARGKMMRLSEDTPSSSPSTYSVSVFDENVNAFVLVARVPPYTYWKTISADGTRLLSSNNEVRTTDSYSLLGALAQDGVADAFLKLSAHGLVAYKVDPVAGKIYLYDLQAPSPYPRSSTVSFTPYPFDSGTWGFVTPDDRMMILCGDDVQGSTTERRITIVPL